MHQRDFRIGAFNIESRNKNNVRTAKNIGILDGVCEYANFLLNFPRELATILANERIKLMENCSQKKVEKLASPKNDTLSTEKHHLQFMKFYRNGFSVDVRACC